VPFVVDDLGAWLVGLLADAARRRLTTWVLGSDQERALRQAANAAVQQTLDQFSPAGDEQARQLTTAIRKALKKPEMAAPQTGQMTLLEALQASIAAQLAVLDTSPTGIGQPATDVRGVSGAELAHSLTSHLMREIVLRGSRGGPLAPLADQLNHDRTYLQGQRVESKLDCLLDEVQDALAWAGGGPEAPRKPVRLPPRPVSLAGREELLAEVSTRLSAGDDPAPRLVALCGLGGAGKTSAAVEYAYRHLAEVEVAWQFPAEDATVLAAGFGELAAQLGARGLADVRDPVASVHAVLARFPAPWLLLFDNAADLASVAVFLPPAGPGRVLITSQNPHWPGQVMDVPVLDPDVAAGFLISRTGDPDRTAARDLAGVLGGLPLALEQAAAYVRATEMTLAGYLSLFRGRAADLLARGQAAGHPVSVAATLGLALSRLGDEAPAAAGLLQLLACLAPEPVPLAVLLSDAQVAGELAPGVAAAAGPLLGDPVAAGDAIAALRRYSLVTPAGDGLVLVHRLVQAVTLARVSADVAGQWKQAAAALVEAAVPADPAVPAAWPVCAVLLPHALAVLDLTSAGIWRITQYLTPSGSYQAARDLYRLIADAHADDDAYGPEHPDTLAALGNLAYSTGEAGDAAGALDLFAVLLPVVERVHGPEHLGTLNARYNLARWAGEAGDAAGARDELAALLPVVERVYGPEDLGTLGVRANLARWTGEAGDAAGARDELAALLPVIERALGPEHPDFVWGACGYLARWTGEAGDAAGALDLFAVLLPVMERALGPDHPSTLDIRHNLARWTGEAGDAAGARDQFAVLLPVRERVLGPEHPDTLATRHSLAYWTERGERDHGTGPITPTPRPQFYARDMGDLSEVTDRYL
jgi:Tetratricopeptide repeat